MAMNARLSSYFASVGHPELYPADGSPTGKDATIKGTSCRVGAACKTEKDVRITIQAASRDAKKSVRFGAASEKQVEMTNIILAGSVEVAPTDSFRRSMSV